MESGTLEDILLFSNGKSIKPGGEGAYPAFGANGVIGRTDDFNYEDAIILGRVGAYCGAVERCEGKFWASDNTIVVKPKIAEHNKSYIYYLLKRLELNKYAGGAAQPLLTQTVLKQVPISYHDSQEQKEIGEILESYDLLIENNSSRISILETMAQNLYREWFVNFRFPGHEQAQWQDTLQGKIPAGWEIKPFTEVANVLGGGTPSTKVPEYWGGNIKFFAPKDAPDSFYVMDTEKGITQKGVEKSSTKVYPKDTVFITARGTVGKVVLPAEEMAMNQSCYALRMRSGKNQRFLFLLTREQVAYLKKNTGGATFDTIVTDTFKAMHVIVPPLKMIQEFESLVNPIIDQVLCLLRKIKNLKQQRDTLLLKLVGHY